MILIQVFKVSFLPMLFKVTGLLGAVQPIWICCHKCAVDEHLKRPGIYCEKVIKPAVR